MKIGFIGTGNMNGALIKGYYKAAEKVGNVIQIFNRTKEKAEKLARNTEIIICNSMENLIENSDVVVLGVEPQNYPEVMPKIAKKFTEDKIFVSIAAGITMKYIESHLGSRSRIVRVMPNTPAMVGMGASALCRNSNVSDESFDIAKEIFGSVGVVAEVSEDMIHAVIGVSGSSPAYTYMYIDALIELGRSNGMSYETAKTFAAQTVMGAARLVLDSEESPAELCDNVCSPGGTTIEAVKWLTENHFKELVVAGGKKSVERSKEITK